MMSSRASANPQQGGQGQQGGASGPPTNEQLTQYMMLAKGMNRETASQELAADPDRIKQEFEKVKQLVEQGGSGGGQGGQQSESGLSGSGSHSGSK